MLGLDNQSLRVKVQKEGDYFGEIGLITLLKRTANVTSMDYCTLSYLEKKTVNEAKE